MIAYLIGMPASGKTTIGKQLAKNLNALFIDLDNYISTKESLTITKLFQEKGEAYFREIENKCLTEVSQTKADTVVSLGGGTPCFYDNMNVILSSGNVFYIHAPQHIIISRIKNGVTKRPLFTNLNDTDLTDKINLLLKQREPFYLKAHYKIDTLTKSKKDIIQEISNHI